MHHISFADYKACYASMHKTCKINKLDTKTADKMTPGECMGICNENSECKFISHLKWNNAWACMLYPSCDEIRPTKRGAFGTTYSKNGKCPGDKE